MCPRISNLDKMPLLISLWKITGLPIGSTDNIQLSGFVQFYSVDFFLRPLSLLMLLLRVHRYV